MTPFEIVKSVNCSPHVDCADDTVCSCHEIAKAIGRENKQLLTALRKIEKRTSDPVARSIAGEAIIVAHEQGGLTDGRK